MYFKHKYDLNVCFGFINCFISHSVLLLEAINGLNVIIYYVFLLLQTFSHSYQY